MFVGKIRAMGRVYLYSTKGALGNKGFY